MRAYQHCCKFNEVILEKPIYRPDEKEFNRQPIKEESNRWHQRGVNKCTTKAQTGLRPGEKRVKKG
jgi:hypothetical protein